MLLHHYMGEIDGAFRAWGFQKGGTGAISESIAGAARRFGAEIRTSAGVERVLHATAAPPAWRSKAARRSPRPSWCRVSIRGSHFTRLLEPQALPAELVEGIRRYKFRGSSGKVNLALAGLPNFTCMPGVGPHLRGAVSISPSLDYLERAYDDAKYGEFSEHPYMDIVIPSMIDPGMAPPGKHVMSIFVQYAPYALNGGWNDAKREAFGDAVVKTLAHYAPNLPSLILHRQVLTPHDIEQITGLSKATSSRASSRCSSSSSCVPCRSGPVPHADPRLLAVRRRHPPRRRHHGRIGARSRRSRSSRSPRERPSRRGGGGRRR